MLELTNKKCIPCSSDLPPMNDQEIALQRILIPQWQVIEEDQIKKLRRVFSFENFKSALAFTNTIGELAEAEGHHPLITTEWGKVTLMWWTHKIKGLHENDFIMAAKSDLLYKDR